MNPPSDIVNKECQALIYLTNSRLIKAHRPLTCLYSTTKHGKKLSTLTDVLKNYEGELVWLFKHKFK